MLIILTLNPDFANFSESGEWISIKEDSRFGETYSYANTQQELMNDDMLTIAGGHLQDEPND